jgi:hypothetical protein
MVFLIGKRVDQRSAIKLENTRSISSVGFTEFETVKKAPSRIGFVAPTRVDDAQTDGRRRTARERDAERFFLH